MGDVEPKALTVSDQNTSLDKDELQMVLFNKPYEGYEAQTVYDKYEKRVSFGGLVNSINWFGASLFRLLLAKNLVRHSPSRCGRRFTKKVVLPTAVTTCFLKSIWALTSIWKKEVRASIIT
jgi:hypothetical protein